MRDAARASTAGAEPRPTIEFRPATGALHPHIAAFYLYRHDAALIHGVERVDLGQLRYLLKGEGEVTFANGRRMPTRPVMINPPGTAASTYTMRGPFHCFGISLRGIGWKTLVGLPAYRITDSIVDATGGDCGDIPAQLARLQALDDIDAMVAEIAPRLENYIRQSPPVPKTHLAFLAAVREWGAGVDPDLATLYAATAQRAGIGERQVQRLCKDYFAGSPAHLKRKFRAIGAAMRIYQGARIEEVVGPFADQAHMIHEIRHFTGHTPGSLRGNIDPVLAATLDSETFHFLPDVIPEEVDLGALRAHLPIGSN